VDPVQLERFEGKMRDDGLPEIAVQAFRRAVSFAASGGETKVPERTIEPVSKLDRLADFDAASSKLRDLVGRAAVIKLNGGLGTSMGLSRAKSLLPVRPGTSFLDLTARQVIAQRAAWSPPVELPLVLMNSYRTRDDSLAALSNHPGLDGPLALDFVQHRVPRVDATDWSPVMWPADPSLEWCPPGHGDLYIALASSGMLEALRGRGVRYAFISNADNLGAVLDPRILDWMAADDVPFVMEVCERTEADRKGGHLAMRDGALILREVAQCPNEDLGAFQDVTTHRYFNTNNLWLDLDALADVLATNPGGPALPVIVNEKRVSPTDAESPRCLQLETAMGSAIECFEGARAIVVPRERFAPVKTTNDLLTLWSDAYVMTDDARMVASDPEAARERVVDLDARHFGHVEDLQARFPHGAPSLAKCRRFQVIGDHVFGAGVVAEGDVRLVNESDAPVHIPDGTVLGDD